MDLVKLQQQVQHSPLLKKKDQLQQYLQKEVQHNQLQQKLQRELQVLEMLHQFKCGQEE